MLRYLLTLHSFLFFFNDTATTEIYTLSLHDALPIWSCSCPLGQRDAASAHGAGFGGGSCGRGQAVGSRLRAAVRRVGMDRAFPHPGTPGSENENRPPIATDGRRGRAVAQRNPRVRRCRVSPVGLPRRGSGGQHAAEG